MAMERIKMAIGDIKKHTILMYDIMLHYYKDNIGKKSMYAGIKITDKLISIIKQRRSKLSIGYRKRWVR
jgi:hypothetical protein